MKAYHYVLGGPEAVDRILKQGEILPALYRLDRESIAEACDDMMNSLEYAARRDPSMTPAVAAVWGLIDQRLDEMAAAQEGREIEHKETKFRCEDFMAGDLALVFLSMGRWVDELYWDPFDRGGFKPNGFVFDAGFLLGKGGRARRADLFEDYESAVTDLVWHEGYKTEAAAGEALRAKLEAIRRWHESKDLKAAREGAELVFPGPLPIDWAIEVWRDGERLFRVNV